MNCIVYILSRLVSRSPAIVFREANNPYEDIQSGSAWKRLSYFIARQYVYRRANAIVVLDIDLINNITSFYRVRKNNVVTIGNPVIDNTFYQRAEINTSTPSYTVLAVGRVSKQKNYSRLLRVLCLAKAKGHNIQVRIAGRIDDDEEMCRLNQLANDLGVDHLVHYIGHVSNVLPLIKAAKLIVSTSDYEGLPNALIEAAALGKAIVATDSGPGTRSVLRDYPYATIVDIEQEEYFADCVIRYSTQCKISNISHLNNKINSAWSTIPYEVATVKRQYEQLFRSLMG